MSCSLTGNKFLRFYSNQRQNLLGSYLAGFIEGDGSIIIRKGDRKKISPAIIFTYHKNEVPMYEHLKSVLGSGNVYE